MKTQFHIDLETLDTEDSTIIVSIGAVLAYPETGDVDIKNTFYRVCELSQEGRTMSPGTVSFWMKQSDEARKVFTDKDVERISLGESLYDLLNFIVESTPNKKDTEFWANSPDFDLDILEHAFNQYNLETPWEFFQKRDVRTVKSLLPKDSVPTRVGTYHNALDDAIYQAEVVLKGHHLISLGG